MAINKITVLKDRLGNKIIPSTLTKAVQDDNGKKLDVLLSESNSRIGALENDRGYLNIKEIPFNDMNLIKENGIYRILNPINSPMSTTGWMNVVVIKTFDTFVTQIATILESSIYPANTVFVRSCTNDYWHTWQQIATTTKTSFSCTANSGYTIISQDCYVLNGEAHINVSVKKNDGSLFGLGLVNPVTVPYGRWEETAFFALIRNSDNLIVNTSPCVINYTGGLYANVTAEGAIISFCGRIPL